MLQQRSRAEGVVGGGDYTEFAHVNQLAPAIEAIGSMIHRQWRVLVGTVLVCVALAFAYLQLAQPMYRSEIALLIGQPEDRVLQELVDGQPMVANEASILDQIELLGSERIARKVVELMALDRNDAFLAPRVSITARASQLFNETVLAYGSGVLPSWAVEYATIRGEAAALPPDADRTAMAVRRLMENTTIERSGRTSVVFIGYWDPDPARSAEIVQAIGQAYFVDAIDTKVEAVQTTKQWLERRVSELRARSLETDLAVQRFKAENGLLTTEQGFVSDQNFTNLNAQLIEAQAATAAAAARFDRLQETIKSQNIDTVVNDALDSVLINNLRSRYLEAAKRKSDLQRQLGPSHVQVKRLDQEMAEFRALIFEELGRIAESYRNEVEVARLREESLRQAVASATSETEVSNEVRVHLRELEREAETQRTLYSTYLTRYEETLQRESAPTREGRIIAEAKLPEKPAAPKNILVLGAGLVFGLLAGTGLSVLREFQDRFFRTGDQIRAELGQSFLGSIPAIETKRSPVSAVQIEDGQQPKSIVNKISSAYNYVIDHPLSQYAEAMRSAKLSVDLAIRTRKPKVIGVISLLPNEGKSMISVNLAEMIASQRSRTLLIDGDLRQRGVTKAVARHAKAGLVDVLLGTQTTASVLLKNPDSGLEVLPAHGGTYPVHHSSSLLASDSMATLLDDVGKNYDYIVVDLPPIGPVIDALAISDKLDGFVMVVQWGRTPRMAVKNALRSAPLISERCFGVLLNRVDMNALKKYAKQSDGEYYNKLYNSYYRSGLKNHFK